MKVTRIEAIPLLAPLDRPFRTGVATFTAFYTALVRVETDDGVVGYGECLARYQPRAWSDLVNDVLAPLVVGADPFDVETIWERLYRSQGSFSGHSRGILLEAMSGIDIALWDVMGKAVGQPVARLLGGTAREVAAYASSVTVDETPTMAARAAEFVEQGFRSLKVKIGRDVATERSVLRAIRDAVGDDVAIYVDANGAYEYPEALRVAAMLEETGVAWFEEPVRTEYRGSYAKLRAATSIALAAGEGEFTRWGMHELLRTEAIDVIQPDVCRSGGITETRKLWALATLYHARYAPHVGGSGALCAAASVHLAASAPNFWTYECSVPANPLARRCWRSSPSVTLRPCATGGCRCPTGPGSGSRSIPRWWSATVSIAEGAADVYARLGVRRVINGYETVSIVGGTRIHPRGVGRDGGGARRFRRPAGAARGGGAAAGGTDTQRGGGGDQRGVGGDGAGDGGVRRSLRPIVRVAADGAGRARSTATPRGGAAGAHEPLRPERAAGGRRPARGGVRAERHARGAPLGRRSRRRRWPCSTPPAGPTSATASRSSGWSTWRTRRACP